jgi:diguanylate cyclase (GGDEF)-like protein/PAS domain S-box-containing protein
MTGLAVLPDPGEYEALLQFLYMAPVGLAQTDLDGGIIMLNPLSAQLLMPLSRDGALANLFDALGSVAPDLRDICAAYPARHGMVCDGRRLHLSAGAGKPGPQVLSLTLLKLDQSRLMAVLSDITLQDKRERQLCNTDAWLNAIMTSISDYALVTLDRRGHIEAWNASIGRVTGLAADSIVDQPYALFYPAGATTPEQQLDHLREADENGWSLDVGPRLRADGSLFWGSTMISPLPGRSPDSLGAAALSEPAYCMIIRDITDKQEASASVRSASHTDHLTGLCNRRAFFEAAELEMLRRQKAPRPLTLILVDADHFKAVNDQHGHPAGDAVLRHLATSMQSAFRPVDVVARIGGEEFAIMLPSTGLVDAEAAAGRLRRHIETRPTIYEGRLIGCTVSIGVATMDDQLSGLDELMKRADLALYAAKRGGRNRVHCWRAEAAATPVA